MLCRREDLCCSVGGRSCVVVWWFIDLSLLNYVQPIFLRQYQYKHFYIKLFQKYHHAVMFCGVGRSASALLAAIISGRFVSFCRTHNSA